MATATSETRVLDTVFSITLDNIRRTLADNIHSSISTLWFLENRGRGRGIRFEDGGVKIKIPIVYAKNSNVSSYSSYDNITLAPTEEITTAFDDWCEIATSVAISRREMRQNSGMHAMRNLLRDKVDIAEMSMREDINRQIVQGTLSGDSKYFIAGNGGKDMNPLGFMLQKDLTTSVDVHGIDQSTETYWQNQVKDMTTLAVNTGSELKREMGNLYNDCSKGGTIDAPDFIVADQNFFECYEATLMHQQRYGGFADEAAASAGFQSLRFKNALMFWDEFVPGFGTGTNADADTAQDATEAVAFFLNSRWIELVVDQESNFVNTPFEEALNQTAIYSKIIYMAQFVCRQRRKQGLAYDLDTQALDVTG